jgi:hypothetical protein
VRAPSAGNEFRAALWHGAIDQRPVGGRYGKALVGQGANGMEAGRQMAPKDANGRTKRVPRMGLVHGKHSAVRWVGTFIESLGRTL